MNNTSSTRTRRHVVFLLHTHLVFVTKYRKAVFTKQMLLCMKKVFSDICEKFDAELIEFDGEKDHVHLLINYPPKVSISKLVNSLKWVSSRILRNYYGKMFFGLKTILPEVVVEHLLVLLKNTLKNKLHHIKMSAFHTLAEDPEVFQRGRINS